jgi:hypothetical protein
MVNNTALINNTINSTKTKSKQGETVYGYAALNEMGKKQTAAVNKDLENIKKILADETISPAKRKRAKVRLYINYAVQTLMLAPFFFFVGLAVNTLVLS